MIADWKAVLILGCHATNDKDTAEMLLSELFWHLRQLETKSTALRWIDESVVPFDVEKSSDSMIPWLFLKSWFGLRGLRTFQTWVGVSQRCWSRFTDRRVVFRCLFCGHFSFVPHQGDYQELLGCILCRSFQDLAMQHLIPALEHYDCA